jgi:tetratricopeptide (TPR) repeat protein
MRDRHLTSEILQHLLARDGREDNWLLLHHLALCPSCYLVGGYILDLYEAGAIGPDFCSLDLDLARSRAVAPELLEKLDRHEYQKQAGLVRDSPRFQSAGFCECLCAESLKCATENPIRAMELAELAVLVSSLLEEGQPFEEDWLDELRAYAWAHLGNARRALGEIRSAEDAFVRAEEFWEAGVQSAGDALGYEPIILALKASLRLTQGRPPEARALLDQALSADEKHALTGSLLLNKARILEELGEVPEAVHLLEAAPRWIDSETRPQLYFWARHNLLDVLSKSGRQAEAESLLPEVQELGRAHGSEIDRLRLLWVEARLAAGRGQYEEAICRFSEVREGFFTRKMGYDAALVSLDLALILLKQERFAEAKAATEEMLPIFAAADIHREALAALVIFREAAVRGVLTLDLATKIFDYLWRARQNPTLRFANELE